MGGFATALTAVALAGWPARPSLNSWVAQVTPTIQQHMLDNVEPTGTAPGVVVASPSRVEPNYYYYWVRDGSLTMDVIVNLYANAEDRKTQNTYEQILRDFVQLTARNQNSWNPSNGPGEPKFNADGSAFTEPWGRPQDDGPALRALALIHLARVWMATGREADVRQLLYDGTFQSVIKVDLEYVSHNWTETCFDLWEENRGHHFYTRMVQRRALLEGANLARDLGDSGAADWYEQQARALATQLSRHWDDSRQYIVETLDQEGRTSKVSGLDSAVILGALHGGMADGYFAVTDDRLQATVQAEEVVFQNLYAINQQGDPGIGIGRYPEDTYDGRSTGSTFQGNPWFLSTLGFAEFYSRLANAIEDGSPFKITARNQAFVHDLGYSSGRRADLVKLLRAKADGYLACAHMHMDGDHISEQFDRRTGYAMSANDLTWSYASFITAVEQRR